MDEFWKNNGDKVLVGVFSAIIVLFLSEPIKAVFKKIGAWFEGFFQSLGFGFQKRYYRALVHAHQWLKLIGIYNPSDLHFPRLKEVYISLRLNTTKESPTILWNHIFNDNEKHVVILGQPGAGKSTLLDYLTLIFTAHINHPLHVELGKPLPIFVRLRDLGSRPLLELIESPANVGLKKIPAGYFERKLRSGKCIVFLDGLDEVLDETLHKQAVSEILSFTNEYPDNWIFVTCRVAGWHNQLPAFRQYTVQEFDRDGVRQFIDAWYREVTRTTEINKLGTSPKPEAIREAEEYGYQVSLTQAENLWNALLKNESLLRIARTPLILSLTTLVHYNRTSLPKGRARLYRECLDILLDIWDSKDKGIALPDTPSFNDKLLVLKAIAFHYVERGLLEMDIDGLEKLVAPLLPSLTKLVSAQSLIRQIYERSGVLVEQAIGKYGFAHRALHDYLAASHIAEQNLDALLVDHASEERWREITLIAIGLVQPQKRAEILLAALLRRSDESAGSLALAGWSLVEDIQISEELRSSVKTKILDRLVEIQTAADFSLLSGALFDTDTGAMQAWVGSVLSGGNSAQQTRILLSLLPELGEDGCKPFIPMLTLIIADSHADHTLRAQCALAIAKIKPFPDSSLWKALTSARAERDEKLKSTATWAYCELGRFEELGLIKIPAGEFLIGSSDDDKTAYDDEKPQHTPYLPNYYIGKYPTTVDDYHTFIEESGYKTTHDSSLRGTGNHPVVYVNWRDALTFAKWKGLTLPSEAEWEKAARGVYGYIYPWGNEWRSDMSNTREYWVNSARLRLSGRNDPHTTMVGYFSPRSDSPYGCADMSGNVREWTRSVLIDYPYDGSDGREDEDSPRYRVIRGGSFGYDRLLSRCAIRDDRRLDLIRSDIGFRVAISPVFHERL